MKADNLTMDVKKKSVITLMVLAIGIMSLNHARADDWVTEEVLKQLSELRVEVKSLRSDLAIFRDELSVGDVPQRAESPSVINLDLSGNPVLGETSAEYAIVEFTDFQCSYCSRHQRETFPQLIENYIDTGKIRYVSKQFPLDFHLQARDAASFALCAGEQVTDGYWLAHELLFSPGASISSEGFYQLAGELDINHPELQSCMNSVSTSEIIDSDISMGVSVGVTGTPAFYIGRVEGDSVVDGFLVRGAQPYQVFDRVLSNILN